MLTDVVPAFVQSDVEHGQLLVVEVQVEGEGGVYPGSRQSRESTGQDGVERSGGVVGVVA